MNGYSFSAGPLAASIHRTAFWRDENEPMIRRGGGSP